MTTKRIIKESPDTLINTLKYKEDLDTYAEEIQTFLREMFYTNRIYITARFDVYFGYSVIFECNLNNRTTVSYSTDFHYLKDHSHKGILHNIAVTLFEQSKGAILAEYFK